MSSVASAQLATCCAEDNLSIDVSPGRNAWAANCGYISPIARDYFDSEGIYIVFTTGCGFAWCSPYVPISTASPCVSGLVEIGRGAATAAATRSRDAYYRSPRSTFPRELDSFSTMEIAT
jgi:hypothetical protein